MKTLQKNIMRHVYYAFIFRIVMHPVLLQSLALIVAVWWLKELVFVSRVWQSFVATPIGEVGSFVVEVLMQADGLTLAVTLVTTLVAVSLLRRIARTEPIRLSLPAMPAMR